LTQLGNGPAITTEDIVGAAAQAEDVFGATCLTPNTAPTIRRLADLGPTTLAVMHGSCFSGDGSGALLALADDYDRRLVDVQS
ncbi:MAG TPA: MBL fold metallo-hydrolase, partial [Acidimicrobiales bacterium]